MVFLRIPEKSLESEAKQIKTVHRLLFWRLPDVDQPGEWYLDATKTLELSRGSQNREATD